MGSTLIGNELTWYSPGMSDLERRAVSSGRLDRGRVLRRLSLLFVHRPADPARGLGARSATQGGGPRPGGESRLMLSTSLLHGDVAPAGAADDDATRRKGSRRAVVQNAGAERLGTRGRLRRRAAGAPRRAIPVVRFRRRSGAPGLAPRMSWLKWLRRFNCSRSARGSIASSSGLGSGGSSSDRPAFGATGWERSCSRRSSRRSSCSCSCSGCAASRSGPDRARQRARPGTAQLLAQLPDELGVRVRRSLGGSTAAAARR